MMFFIRIGIPAPFGIFMDVFLVIFILGIYIHMYNKKEWLIFRSPISIVILIWIGYNIFEVFNPAAASRLSWLAALRTVALVSVYFFVFLLHVKTKRDLYLSSLSGGSLFHLLAHYMLLNRNLLDSPILNNDTLIQMYLLQNYYS